MSIQERIHDFFVEKGLDEKFNSERISRLRQVVADFFPYSKENSYVKRLLLKGIGYFGEGTVVKPGFRFSRGYNIYLGNKVFINFECFFQDSEKIVIDDFTLIGPNVKIYTSEHDLKSKERTTNPVYVGKGSWIGGGVIILPGVIIGRNSVIGAGSLVNGDIDENSVYAGVPARKIKEIK